MEKNNFKKQLTGKIYHGHAFQDSPKGFNLVTLTDTTATAVLEEDGGIYCQPDVLFEGCSSTTHLLHTDLFFNQLDKVCFGYLSLS